MNLQKRENYRNKTLLNYAKDSPCQFCGSDDKTVVACHISGLYANKCGKGTGLKPDDTASAYMCFDCHDLYDGRTREANFGEAERAAMFAVACANTYRWLLITGRLLVVKRNALDMTQDCI
jgi:hypothetical protein